MSLSGMMMTVLDVRRGVGEGSCADVAGEMVGLRVAVVHDFLQMVAGSERALGGILEMFPRADVFAQFDFVPEGQRGFLRGKEVRTTFLQKVPGMRGRYRHFMPLMPLAAESHDVSGYDLVISNSSVAAKGVRTRPGQLHICYCHTPARFAWDPETHLAAAGMRGVRGAVARRLIERFRQWDARAAKGVDLFLSNSRFISERIRRAYGRESTVVYPPVDVDGFCLREEKEDFYVTVSRLVPYKRVEVIVDAFGAMPGKKLVVIGDGPELGRLRRRAKGNVEVLGFVPQEELAEQVSRARGFVFAAEEDFGIAPVEAQACGTPVIAYGRGGVLETVVPGVTGMFFGEQTAAAVVGAVRDFEEQEWDAARIREHAERFGPEHFRRAFMREVERAWRGFSEGLVRDDGVIES